MSETLLQKVDYKESPQEVLPTPHSTASVALELGSLAMKFARIDRVPRYEDGQRESDVEHSFMLGLVATELGQMLYPAKLNHGKVTQYALVHDLVEVKTGDIATFDLDSDALADKEKAEHAALEALLQELPPFMRTLLYDYEQQQDIEARFVRAVDKLLPLIVDIIGQGRRVLSEDYGITSSDQLRVCHERLSERMRQRFGEFPELVSDQALLAELVELECQF